MSTMTKIIINKGFISHEGRIYHTGDVVSIADGKMAKRLVARSGGDFAFYHENVPDSGTEDEDVTKNPAENAEDNVSDSDTETGAEDTDDGLPALDPDAAMQTGKGNKGGGGKKK